MTEKEIVAKINDVLSTGFELDSALLKPEARLKEDLQLDSLDAVDMLVYLEENFKIQVEGERLTEIKVLGDVYKLVTDVLLNAKPHTQLSEKF